MRMQFLNFLLMMHSLSFKPLGGGLDIKSDEYIYF